MTADSRLHGIDILRLFSVIAILHFHVHETFFFSDLPIYSPHQALYAWLEPYSRTLAFSGFTVVALSSFFLGKSRFRESRWSFVLLLMWLGCFCLASLESDATHWFYFEWDIYQFLLVSFSLIYFVQKSPRALAVSGVVGSVALSLPLWRWTESWPLSGLWRDATFGNCAAIAHGKGGWPLLPWMGLPFVFFALGREVRSRVRLRAILSQGRPAEWWLWPAVLVASVPWLGGYYGVSIGPGFNCFMHRQSPAVFWSHITWVVFLSRLSFLDVVQRWLARFWWARLISSLQWSRHFGTCYALHFLWLEVGYLALPTFYIHPQALDLFLLSLFPVTECMSFVFHGGLRLLAKRFDRFELQASG